MHHAIEAKEQRGRKGGGRSADAGWVVAERRKPSGLTGEKKSERKETGGGGKKRKVRLAWFFLGGWGDSFPLFHFLYS